MWFVFVMFCCILCHVHAAIDVSKVQGTFLYISQSTDATSPGARCARAITHLKVAKYTNINPLSLETPTYAVRWRHLVVDGSACKRSERRTTATILLESTVSDNTPWFVAGQDNSARVCGNFTPTFPARYYFIDDLPRFRELFIDRNYLTAAQVAGSAVISNARKGEIFMMSQQFSPDSGNTVASRTVCLYRLNRPSPSPSPSPVTATPTPEPPRCFPSHARVNVRGTGSVRMHDLKIGQSVQVAPGIYSPVFMFTHRQPKIRSPFISITTEHNASILLSHGHYVRLADLRLVPAYQVNSSHRLLVHVPCNPKGQQLLPSRVLRVSEVPHVRGLYSPHTLHGDMLVDGLLVSSYTTAVHPRLAHTLLAPLRVLYNLLAMSPRLFELGIASSILRPLRLLAVWTGVDSVNNIDL